MRLTAFATIAGLASVVLYAAAFTGSAIGIMLAYLCQIPLFAIGLSHGIRGLAIAGGVALLAILAAGGVQFAAFFLAPHLIPIALICVLFLSKVGRGEDERWLPVGNVMALLGILGATGVVLAGITFSGENGFEATVIAFLEAAFASLEEIAPGMATTAPDMAVSWAGVLPGIVALSWMLMISLNGMVTQTLLRSAGKALRPTPTMAELSVPRSYLFVLGVAAALSIANSGNLGYIAGNACLALAWPFFFQGLAVVHAMAARYKAGTPGLVAFYILLIVISWIGLLVMLAGVADALFNIRRRLAETGSSSED